jgi:hypothetical protein
MIAIQVAETRSPLLTSKDICCVDEPFAGFIVTLKHSVDELP